MSRRPPVRMPAWMPAPRATTSSGSMLDERRPPEELLHVGGAPAACAWSRRPRPPPRRPPASRPASLSACRHGPAGALDQVAHQRLELVARDDAADRPSRPASPARSSVSVASDSARFARSAIASTWARTCGCVAQRLGQLGQQQLGEARVEVVAAEPRVAAGRQHLEDAAAQLQDGDVEGAAAQVVDRDGALGALVQAVGQRGRGRLVHQPQHLEPGEPAGILRRLPLAVVEVGRHGDHGLRRPARPAPPRPSA